MNTETPFTPGPWRHDGNEVSADAGVIVRSSAAYDALGHDLDLIAAAPEMLDALKRAQDAMRHIGVQPYAYGDNVLAKALHAAELAIAKAEKGGEA